MANYTFTKSITGISNQTLYSFFGAGSILAPNANNKIIKILFICEPNSNLTAVSAIQNTSCFNVEGDTIKIAQNPAGATTNIFYEINPENMTGDFLDLRTALKFTATGNVHVILFF